jgi:hypothetical protein
MGLEVDGYHDRTNWLKMGPSLLIATALIVAIRSAKWALKWGTSLSGAEAGCCDPFRRERFVPRDDHTDRKIRIDLPSAKGAVVHDC